MACYFQSGYLQSVSHRDRFFERYPAFCLRYQYCADLRTLAAPKVGILSRHRGIAHRTINALAAKCTWLHLYFDHQLYCADSGFDVQKIVFPEEFIVGYSYQFFLIST